MTDLPSDRVIGARFAVDAAKIITEQRGQQHGELEPSFTLIAEWWSSLINHRAGAWQQPVIRLDAVDVLEMMSMLKKARGIYGSLNPDNSVDDIGYAALAGGLRLRDPIHQKVIAEVEAAMKAKSAGAGVQAPTEGDAAGQEADPPQPGTPGVDGPDLQALDKTMQDSGTIEIPAFLRRPKAEAVEEIPQGGDA